MIRKENDLSVRRQCELLGVTRSKVYYTPKEPDAEVIERKERIMALIDYWHTENPASCSDLTTVLSLVLRCAFPC